MTSYEFIEKIKKNKKELIIYDFTIKDLANEINLAINNEDKIEIYKSKKEWHWRRISNNGKITGASTERYKNKIECVKNFLRQLSFGRIIVQP